MPVIAELMACVAYIITYHWVIGLVLDLTHNLLLVICGFPKCSFKHFHPGGGVFCVLEKHWPAYNIVSIRICSCRKWLVLRRVWSWPLLARVLFICPLYSVSLYNQTFSQQIKKLISELQHFYKPLPGLMWQNQLGMFQVVTGGSVKYQRRKKILTLHITWTQMWLSDGRA